MVQLRMIIRFRIKELSLIRSYTQSLVWAGPALGAGNVALGKTDSLASDVGGGGESRYPDDFRLR